MKNNNTNKIIITDKNEKEYWIEYKKTSSHQIREALINRYAPLVKYKANKMQFIMKMPRIMTYVDFDDVESFGFLGLSDAIDRYNPKNESDIKFETYASVKIQEAIYDELRKIDVLPKHIHKEIREIAIVIKILEIKLKEKAKPKEIAEILEITVEEYNETMKYTFPHYVNVISLDEACWYIKVEALLQNKETKEEFMDALKKLPQRWYEVLTLYYYKELTIEEIGNIFEISERRVAQITGKAIQDLRDILMKKENNN